LGETLVLGASASIYLAKSISEGLNARFAPLDTKIFPDGEIYVRIPVKVHGKDVIIVQSMYRTPNSFLIELIFAAETLRELGARRVVGVIPYLPYLRQDERFKPGEAVSAKIVGKMLGVRLDKIYTVDAHLHRIRSLKEIFEVEVVNLSIISELARVAIKEFGLNNPILIAPDEEAEQWVEKAAETLNCNYIVLRKERIGDEEVSITGLERIAGDTLIIDDIISTGGTVAEAAKLLYERGAERVYVAAVHGIFVKGAEKRLFESGVRGVLTSDSIPSPYSKVSIAPLISNILRKEL